MCKMLLGRLVCVEQCLHDSGGMKALSLLASKLLGQAKLK